MWPRVGGLDAGTDRKGQHRHSEHREVAHDHSPFALGGRRRGETGGLQPASTSETARRRRADDRMTSFSASTTRKNASPPAISQGQKRSGMASVPNVAWSGAA